MCWQQIGADGQHAELASVHSQHEADMIAQYLAYSPSYTNTWIGLSRASDGSFSWIDRSAYDFEYWYDGEPNSNGSDGEDCVEIYSWSSAQWNDAHCSNAMNDYICMTNKRMLFLPQGVPK